MPELPGDARLWEDILAELERNARSAVNRAKADAAAPTAWTPPTGIPPIPPALLERAQTLLATQLEAARLIEAVRDTTRQHLVAVRGLAPAASASVYLDVHG